MKYAKGIMWLDDCRIPFTTDDKFDIRRYDTNSVFRMDNPQTTYEVNEPNQQGRFTPNLLVCDDMLNDGSISKGQKNPRIQKTTRRYGENNFTNGGLFTPEGNITATYNDMGSSSRYYDLDKWFDMMVNNL